MTSFSFDTPPEAVRIFCGFRRQGLDADQFYRDLGNTFMPGTVYMLQPLGLHAYAAAVFDQGAHSGTPHETAIIGYPSQATYQAMRHETLRGRVYTQTHGGVYEPGVSRSDFPKPFVEGLDSSRTVHLFQGASDLHTGALMVHMVVPPDSATSGNDFRRQISAALPKLRRDLEAKGAFQAFVVIQDFFVVVWTHATDLAAKDVVAHWGADTGHLAADMQCEPVICLDEPPTLSIVGSAAFNFVFLRDARAALGQGI
jgi:hypothetical protein